MLEVSGVTVQSCGYLKFAFICRMPPPSVAAVVGSAAGNSEGQGTGRGGGETAGTVLETQVCLIMYLASIRSEMNAFLLSLNGLAVSLEILLFDDSVIKVQ